ncbi:MAG: SDR family NAD(P)-dependent oxidoreductase, partial [Oscillospiraceae bacterium]|nr:SDR family NAD(P)-dependent oxidoreductase [Oscillospiraceae bacterium]
MENTVFITGGSRGIGAACVQLFAQQGWQVAFTYNRNEAAAVALAKKLQNGGGRLLAISCDVAKKEQVDAAFEQARRHFGPISILVNNAGIAQQKMFCDITAQDWDMMFDVNVKGMYHCIQAALPDMIHLKAGKIVNVSSMWGQ